MHGLFLFFVFKLFGKVVFSHQIHQIEFPGQLLLVLEVLLLDVDEEDAVAAGAVLVHVWEKRKRK